MFGQRFFIFYEASIIYYFSLTLQECKRPLLSEFITIFIAEGMKLYISDNNVILTEGFDGVVPVKYIEKIESWPDRKLIPFWTWITVGVFLPQLSVSCPSKEIYSYYLGRSEPSYSFINQDHGLTDECRFCLGIMLLLLWLADLKLLGVVLMS